MASGAVAIAVMMESPRSVFREVTCTSAEDPPLAPALHGASLGYSASICQPEPPSAFGGWQASTLTGDTSGKRALTCVREQRESVVNSVASSCAASTKAGPAVLSALQTEWARPPLVRGVSRRRRAGVSAVDETKAAMEQGSAMEKTQQWSKAHRVEIAGARGIWLNLEGAAGEGEDFKHAAPRGGPADLERVGFGAWRGASWLGDASAACA